MIKPYKLLAYYYRQNLAKVEALRDSEITPARRGEMLAGFEKTPGPVQSVLMPEKELEKTLPVVFPDFGRCSLVFYSNGTFAVIDYRLPPRTAEDLIADYRFQDVCAAEVLADTEVPAGMDFEKAFELYVEVMKIVEGDTFTVTKEGQTTIL